MQTGFDEGVLKEKLIWDFYNLETEGNMIEKDSKSSNMSTGKQKSPHFSGD